MAKLSSASPLLRRSAAVVVVVAAALVPACADEPLLPIPPTPGAEPPAHAEPHGRPRTHAGSPALPATVQGERLWVLVGAIDPLADPPPPMGLFLVDLERQTVARTLPLPAGERWDGLVDEGDTLVLAGLLSAPFDEAACAIVVLDEATGAERARSTGVCAEGLAHDARGLWAGGDTYNLNASGADIRLLDRDLGVIDTIPAGAPASDLASDGERLFFVTYYSAFDGVSVVDPDGTTSLLAPREGRWSGAPLYAVAVEGARVIACAYPNECRALDRVSGEDRGPLPLPVDGWVTAVAVPVD